MKTRSLVVLLLLLPVLSAPAADKPRLTLDEFFNFIGFTDVKISPDGCAIVIGTLRADWDQSIFRKDLWLYRDDASGDGTLTQLTQSGHDAQPQWSPDGRWIAFLSERKTDKKESDSNSKSEDTAQVYVISSSGDEAFPVTKGEEEVHAFSWSPDSRILYFATRTPWTKAQKDTHTEAVENNLHWASDNRHIFFTVEVGDVTGHYRDLQPHLYWADIDTGEVRKWAKDFSGAVDRYDVAGDQVFVIGTLGTEVPLYSSAKPSNPLAKLDGWSGTYERISAAEY